jgi:transcriptional regulator with XRE-family HTH domain
MPSRERTYDRARLRAQDIVRSIAAELRGARISAGRSQLDVATAARISQSQLARIEAGLNRTVSLETLTVVAAVVGLDLVARTYAGPRIVRDQPQLRLMGDFGHGIGPMWWWRYEVRVGPGDQRAWDARVRHRQTGVEFVVEAETRIHDIQALLRRVALKRDVADVRVILLVAGTHNNRRAVEAGAAVLRAEFPIGTRACLAALARGEDPGADGIILLDPPRTKKRVVDPVAAR